MAEPLKTHLHDKHVAMEANMAEEAGWLVPLSYGDPLAEVSHIRGRAGVSDLSHVGRIRIRGDESLDLLERACTHDVAHMEDDTAADTLLLDEQAGILDLARLIRLGSFWVLLTGPSQRTAVLEHLQRLADGFSAKVDDQTSKTSMLGVAGPEAPGLLDAVLPFRASGLGPGQVLFGTLMVARYIAQREDFAGEWGVQVQVPGMLAGQAWRFITDKAGNNALPPVGTAALDVLRIEAGRLRYGHEINLTIDPLTAGLERLIHWEHEFIGRDALALKREKRPARRLVRLVLDAGAQTPIPRLGDAVASPDGREIGSVTSGTFSPRLDAPIAMAYVAADTAEGAEVRVGEAQATARVRGLPFA